jgi:hypothetical protein
VFPGGQFGGGSIANGSGSQVTTSRWQASQKHLPGLDFDPQGYRDRGAAVLAALAR